MMDGEKADLGVVGLAVMGANLARNAASHGWGVALFNRHEERTTALIREHGSEGRFIPTRNLPEFVAALKTPRIAIVLVKAGKPVDDMIDELVPHLEPGDILVDAGNSLFSDTMRRGKACEAKGARFVGMGVSGGEEGALKGPSIMPGGDRDAYDRLAPFIVKMAAQAFGRPCCAYIGPDGAGHYVKMVHNGIEYADMQLIAETYDILKSVYGLSAVAIGDVFADWKSSVLDSYLIDIAAEVLRKTDATGAPLVDRIVDEAEQKGTGRWTAQSALEIGVPITAITEAVYGRALSSRRELRATAARHFANPQFAQRKADPTELHALRDGLYASKIVAYEQGFEQMAVASAQYGWRVNLSEIAAIWRGGCIIRARMLDRVMDAYERDPSLQSLLLADHFRDAVTAAEGGWRQSVSLAIAAGIPAPAFSSTLAYYDGFRRARGPANLLQGLRDYFGAHTYRRLDKPGVFHTRWAQDGAEVQVG